MICEDYAALGEILVFDDREECKTAQDLLNVGCSKTCGINIDCLKYCEKHKLENNKWAVRKRSDRMTGIEGVLNYTEQSIFTGERGVDYN